MIIYKIVNKINGKVYVGQTRQILQKRIAFHVWHNETPIQKALNKYGINNFTITIIDDAGSREVLNEKEQYWIKELNCMAPNGYNLTAGGEGLLYPSEETRRKIGEKSKGRKWSDASKKKLSASKKGMTYNMTEEGIDNIRKAHKGKKWTKERKERMAKSLTGRKLTEEHKKNIKMNHFRNKDKVEPSQREDKSVKNK
jgi:group I intron endonuclease